MYIAAGFERCLTGHLSENRAGAGLAAFAAGEIEGAVGISLGPSIGRGEGGDGEKEEAPLKVPRWQNFALLLRCGKILPFPLIKFCLRALGGKIHLPPGIKLSGSMCDFELYTHGKASTMPIQH